MRARHRRSIRGLLGVGLLGVGLISILVAAAQAGHQVSRALVGNRYVYVINGNGLSRIDTETAQVDGLSDKAVPEDAQVAQPPAAGVGPGHIIAPSGDRLIPFDPHTLVQGAPQQFSEGVQALPGSRVTYFAEPGLRQVRVGTDGDRTATTPTTPTASPAPGATSAPGPATTPGQPVRVDGGWRGVPVVDSGDVLWLLSRDGRTLLRCDRCGPGRDLRPIQITGATATALTLIDDRPAVLAGTKLLLLSEDGWEQHSLDVKSGAEYTLAAPADAGPVAWLVERSGGSASLIRVDLRTSRQGEVPIDAPASAVQQPPVVTPNDVYLPVSNQGYEVRRFDARTGQLRGSRPLDTPRGPDQPLELTLRNGHVSAHVRGTNRTFVFNPDRPDGQLVPTEGADGPGARPGPTAPATAPTSPSPSVPPATSTRPPVAATPRAPRQSPRVTSPPPAPAQRTPAGSRPASPAPGGPPATPPTTPVPDVTGQEPAAGCQRIRNAGLACMSRPVLDLFGDGEDGRVQRSDPPAGAQVSRGTEVTLFYRSSYMPDLTGVPYGEACARVRAPARCSPPQPAAAAAPTHTLAGTIATQSVAAGTEITRETNVTLTYYATFTVPDLVGQEAAAACAAVASALQCTPRAGGPGSAAQPPGTITAQDPVGGTPASISAPLTVTVAGAQPVVPAVTGLSPADACARVQQAGLTCQPQVSPNRAPNVVFTQNPPANSPTDPQAAVVVSYWPAGEVTITRFRQADKDRVWVLRGEGTTAVPGYTVEGYAGASALGTGDPAVASFLKPIADYQCPRSQCRYNVNHYLTDGAAPGGAGWQLLMSSAAWVFREQYSAEMVPLYRLTDGNSGWAYAIQGSDAWGAYTTNSGFTADALLGWVWNN